MNWWLVIIIPVTSALIGYVSNRLLIKMLFRISPKRQQQLAQTLGAMASRELLSFNDLEEKITNPESIKKIMPVAEVHIDDFLRNKLKDAFPMIGMLIGERTINTLKDIFMNELETIFPVIMKEYLQNLQTDLNLEQTITNKIAAMQADKIEATLHQTMGKELQMAGLFGAAIGLFIGVVQVVVIMTLG
jgi:uncharacterized membrane protein YheB (UPF0754 family)